MTLRRLLLCVLALLLAPLAALLWPLPAHRTGVVTTIWTLGIFVLFLVMVAPGLLAMWFAALLVPFWGWRANSGQE